MLRAGFARLLVTIALALALSIGGLVALILHWSESWTLAQIDREIDAEIGDLSAFYEQRRLLGLKELVEERSNWRTSVGAAYLLAYGKSGDRLAGNVSHWPVQAQYERPFTFAAADELGGESGVQTRARAVLLNNAFRLLVARSLEPRMALVRDFQRLLPFLAAAIGLLGLLAAYATGRALMRRLDAINATSRAVEAGNLDARAPGGERQDEIGDLARHVNRMLERMSSLLDATRQQSDRIAHELRTPMMRLRARLQQSKAAAPDGLKDNIEDAIDETRKLSVLFDALLDISRIETHAQAGGALEATDMRDVVMEVGEFYGALADERGIELKIDAPALILVAGDRILLQRLVANLTDNAIKFSPRGASVEISLRQSSGRFRLAVSDEGAGMDAEFAARAFDRFSRSARDHAKDGFGLGLALVHAIVRRHGFEIAIEHRTPGLAIIVSGRCAAEASTGSV